MVSTVKDRDRIWLSFPGASIALKWKVWGPFGSGAARVYGDEQAVNGAAS